MQREKAAFEKKTNILTLHINVAFIFRGISGRVGIKHYVWAEPGFGGNMLWC